MEASRWPLVEDSREREALILSLMASMFGAVIVLANVAAGVKLEVVLGLVVPAGTLAYAVTFIITDIVDELWGKRRAVYIVWGGLAAEIIMLVLIGIEYRIPALNPSQEELFKTVFSSQPRIVLASIIAYLVSQHHDVWAFWKLREFTRGRLLWLRNNASTMVSQLIDTTIFITIAFAGTVTGTVLVNMILATWLFKVLVAALDTPVVYAGVSLIRNYVRQDMDSLMQGRTGIIKQ
ncbi:MAG: queuosine precursor transporter [Desulfurococcales archaeon]|nr:queuosine precursor transporter [Desulfurococcales archaeon]